MKKTSGKTTSSGLVPGGSARLPSPDDFDEVMQMIEAARVRAVAADNTTLIELYWALGEYIGRKIESAARGEGVVDQLAAHIARKRPGLRGNTRRNLFRMRQFHETYRGDEKVSALLTQLPWTHHLLILSKSKRPEEREFYLRMAATQH
jgi:predicted nuclease of restriction endonuclease-like (RecB) superfamily